MTAITLRPYQRAAVEQALKHLTAGHHPVVQLPTGTGKSYVLAEVTARLVAQGQRVLILTHVVGILQQDLDAYVAYTDQLPDVISNSLGVRVRGAPVALGTVQTVARRAGNGLDLSYDVIIVDEVHAVPPGPTGKLYRTVWEAYPEARRVGLSATPWRRDGGRVWGTPEAWFTHLAYQGDIVCMTEEGWLAPLVGCHAALQLDCRGLQRVDGDYVAAAAGDALAEQQLVGSIVEHSLRAAAGRKALAVYAPTIATAEAFRAAYASAGVPAACLHSRQDADINEAALRAYRAGDLRVLVSVGMLTTGFDYPALDTLVVVRPTTSSALWVQILGRGTRPAPGKKNCLVLDYAGNYVRLGGAGTSVEEDYYVETEEGAPPVRASTLGKRVFERLRVAAGLVPAHVLARRALPHRVTGQVRNRTVLRVVGRKRRLPMVLISYRLEVEEGVQITAERFLLLEHGGRPRAEALHWLRRAGGGTAATAWQGVAEARRSPIPLTAVAERKDGRWYVQEETWV